MFWFGFNVVYWYGLVACCGVILLLEFGCCFTVGLCIGIVCVNSVDMVLLLW